MADQELKPENCLKLRGVTIDDKFNFYEHIVGLCRKISQKFSVLNRFERLLPFDVKLKLTIPLFFHILITVLLCGTFNLSVLICSKSDADKLQKLKK